MRRDNSADQDIQHLRLLSIFHYVLSGLQIFSGCLLVFYFGFIFSLVMADPNGPPPEFGIIMGFMASISLLMIVVMATMKILAGRWLQLHTHYTFCFVVACIECLNVPHGTVLGVFTIIVLMRPSVIALFEGKPLFAPHLDDFDDISPDDDRAASMPRWTHDDGAIRE